MHSRRSFLKNLCASSAAIVVAPAMAIDLLHEELEPRRTYVDMGCFFRPYVFEQYVIDDIVCVKVGGVIHRAAFCVDWDRTGRFLPSDYGGQVLAMTTDAVQHFNKGDRVQIGGQPFTIDRDGAYSIQAVNYPNGAIDFRVMPLGEPHDMLVPDHVVSVAGNYIATLRT